MKFLTHISVILLTLAAVCGAGLAQESPRPQVTASGIKIGERLTYNMSFQRYDNVGFAELFAVSRGKLGEADAVELRMKVKTSGILSAAFYQIDQTRTTFANAETGSPLLVRHQDHSHVSVRETVFNYVVAPSPGLDLLTLIYKMRQTAGGGSFILQEGDRSYSITFTPQSAERVRTDAGEYDTSIVTVQSEYLTEIGISGMKMYFSTDEERIPVQVKFKTSRGDFRIALAAVQMVEPEVETAPTPNPAQTPRTNTRPRPTPTPYINNEPLSPELGFVLGERLTYRVSRGDRALADIAFEAKERKFMSGSDSLVLSATVVAAEQGNSVFSNGDSIVTRVDPETLAPAEIIVKLSGPLGAFTEVARFDQRAGAISAGPNRIDAPVGTHNLLSLIYAIRSFNLVPSRDLRNPVNDTRVAVYWQKKAQIFVLRPFQAEPITVNGLKVSAQKISIKTDIPQIDSQGLIVWLTDDAPRVPVRITLGQYKADLISQTTNPVK